MYFMYIQCCSSAPEIRLSVVDTGAAPHPRGAAASGQLPGDDDSGAVPTPVQPHHGPSRHRILKQSGDQVRGGTRHRDAFCSASQGLADHRPWRAQ